jgi:hypothetical protein
MPGFGSPTAYYQKGAIVPPLFILLLIVIISLLCALMLGFCIYISLFEAEAQETVGRQREFYCPRWSRAGCHEIIMIEGLTARHCDGFKRSGGSLRLQS